LSFPPTPPGRWEHGGMNGSHLNLPTLYSLVAQEKAVGVDAPQSAAQTTKFTMVTATSIELPKTPVRKPMYIHTM